jgi:hypothetical protein
MRGTRHAARHRGHRHHHVAGCGGIERKIARLEEHQRDLEEETAEVAELIKRLRERQAAEATDATSTSEA